MNKWIVLLLCFNCLVLGAQNNNYTAKDTIPTISITGTSTLHDWKVQAGSVTNYPDTLVVDVKEGANLTGFSFTVEVVSLDGGRGAAMNNKIQTAFNIAENPTITFTQKEAAILTKSEEGYQLSATGLLNMAGTEKTITVDAFAYKEEGELVLKGSKDLKMSDYGMTPPSAMFGQIQTKDDITVHFEFVYVQ